MINILIIDDSKTIIKMLSRMLSYMNHNVVATAENGQKGIALYKEHKPDLITMDINMPGLSGIQALEAILQFDKNANIIMLTSLSDDKYVLEAIQKGAKGYILKPLNYQKIEECINSIIKDDIKTTKKKEHNIKFEELIKDDLTGFYTKEYMTHTINNFITLNHRDSNISIGLFIITINNLDDILRNFSLRQVNIIIRKIANKIKTTLRSIDFFIRLKNNQFAIFIIGESTENMMLISDKIHNNIDNLNQHLESHNMALVVNIGISTYQKSETLEDFLKRTQRLSLQASIYEQRGVFIQKDF